MGRDRLISVINDTLDKCENEYKWMIDESENVFYNENDLKIRTNEFSNQVDIKLVQQTTVEAIENNSDEVYAVLNFASAKNPGGGVLKGSVAQEEALARVSTLYPVIKECKEFYGRKFKNQYYTDKIIYSKSIYVIKNDYYVGIEPIKCDVITCAAPNYNFGTLFLEEHIKVMTRRFSKVLESAINNNQRNLILGAWGCGVFKNPPDVNAQIFRTVLNKYSKYFSNIIFAIPDDKNFNIFKENL